MKRYIIILIVLLSLASCTKHSEHWETLAQVESYIEERPDSALVVLQGIYNEELANDEERAKHALLLSMALDKNYIDKTDFEVLQPAIDYYEDNGSATDKLRTYFYQGRIYQNAEDNDSAMECFIIALSEGTASEDTKTKARVCFAQFRMNYSLYEWDNCIENLLYAAPLYEESGLNNYYIDCISLIANCYTLKKDYSGAEPYVNECKQLIGSMSLPTLCTFYSSYITYIQGCGTDAELKDAVDEYLNTITAENIDWLTLANAYIKLGQYEDALQAIEQYKYSANTSEEIKYKALKSEIYERLGRYEESLRAYKEYMVVSDSTTWAIMQQDTKFVEERHNLELQTIKEKESKIRVILWSALFIVILLAIIVFIRYRLKVNRMEKDIAEQETEKYRLLYLQMEEERDNLTNLLAQSDELAPDVKTAVGKRLELLNKFFTAFITNNSDIDRTASKEMEELLANKDTFMVSTKLAFTGSHPKFIKYLEERGLTDWEISYCCLYGLGLKGKEVGSYIKMRSHYNNSSEVREKLGINEHDTNLGIYIRKLLKSFE